MATCAYCAAQKGKRACPALGGVICSSCCGKHRLAEIECPHDCTWLGGLAVARGRAMATFTDADYDAATEKLFDYVESRGRPHQREALAVLLGPHEELDPDDPFLEELAPLLNAFVSHAHRGADGLRAIDRYLAGHGRALSPAEAAALRALQQAWPSLFEITAVRPGEGFTVRDRILDESFELRDPSASPRFGGGDVLFAWMMPVGDALELTDAGVTMPPGTLDAMQRLLVDAVAHARTSSPDVPIRRVLADVAGLALDTLRDSDLGRTGPWHQPAPGEPRPTPPATDAPAPDLSADGEDEPDFAALGYDGDRAPDPTAWLAADEGVRLAAVRAHHDTLAGHPAVPNPILHATLHMVVENQLASDEPPETAATLARLIAAGTTRHEAIHAVASVVAAELHAMLAARRDVDRTAIAAALATLRAEDWSGLIR